MSKNSFHKGNVIVRADAAYPQGALVVDGFNSSAHLLAHPMGGGLQLIIPPSDVPQFGIANEWEKTSVFRRAQFSIEGIAEKFRGWTDGHHWNGWAMPFFEGGEALRVVAVFDPNDARYEAATDSFITVTADGEEESWHGEIIALPDGGTAKLYPVGAGSWIWEEEDWSWA